MNKEIKTAEYPIEIKNAVIKEAVICTDRGCLSAWIVLNYDGAEQGFGGYALYLPKSFSRHKLESLAGHFIFRVMEIAGVDTWESLKGKTIRVKRTDFRINAIGHERPIENDMRAVLPP